MCCGDGHLAPSRQSDGQLVSPQPVNFAESWREATVCFPDEQLHVWKRQGEDQHFEGTQEK